MNSKRFLIKLQYLGFRYHGVQKQDQYQSIQGRIEKLLRIHFLSVEFTTRFSSRTDALVSALEAYCLLMFDTPQDEAELSLVLKHLPPDIQVQQVLAVSDQFTLLKAAGVKEYHYFFSHDESAPNAFASPFMTILREKLDLALMKQGAALYVGTHNFKNYCFKPKIGTQFERSIMSCEIVENLDFTASFFPKKSYVLKIRGQGFMRGQVRLIMGALFRLGKNETTILELKMSLIESDPGFIKWMVPSSGLILKSTEMTIK